MTSTGGLAGPTIRQRLDAAVETLRAELEALDEREFVFLNVPPRIVFIELLAAHRRLEPLRPLLFERLKDLTAEDIDKTLTYADALFACESVFSGLRVQRRRPMKKELDEAHALRARMIADLQPFIVRGVLPKDMLKDFRKRRGVAALSEDLFRLLAVRQRFPGPVFGREIIASEDADRAVELLSELGVARASQKDVPAEQTHILDLRKRVFTLAVRHHERLRAAVQYVRWRERDAEKYVRSLYGIRAREGRARAKRRRRNAAARVRELSAPKSAHAALASVTPTHVSARYVLPKIIS